MGQRAAIRHVSFIIPQPLHALSTAHLFPGDDDEHGLVIAAGIDDRGGHLRLLARDIFLAEDGKDYIPGNRGYRMLKAEFIHSKIRYCRQHRLAYIAIHNHGGSDSVAFSAADFASHERGYPALRDLGEGIPVGAAVYARRAIAGDIWLPDGSRHSLAETRVIGTNFARYYATTSNAHIGKPKFPIYDRQVLMFGTTGQRLLRQATVGVIGAGGVGSLIVEYLARLGIGRLIVADPDKVSLSNLSRIVGARLWDARYPFSASKLSWMADQAKRYSARKVDIAKRLARDANPDSVVEPIYGDFAQDGITQRFLDCDFIFLAADSMRARLVFNAIVQQYFIPGVQIGSKIITEQDSSTISDAFSAERWVLPRQNCLWCSGMISSHQLAIEAKSPERKKQEAYGTNVANPSVITMNAVGASHAVNDFLFSYLGLYDESVTAHPRRFKHLAHAVVDERYPRDEDCSECGDTTESRFGRGGSQSLPTITPSVSSLSRRR